MEPVSLSAALEQEHRAIDGGIEQFTTASESGTRDAAPLTRALEGLRRHIYLEEEFLFPPLREAGMIMPIMVMIREHGELWRTMDKIDDLMADVSDPTILELCRELLSLLDRHNSKEEPIIYAQADAKLTADESSRLSDFLRSGSTPDGWVCSAAQQALP